MLGFTRVAIDVFKIQTRDQILYLNDRSPFNVGSRQLRDLLSGRPSLIREAVELSDVPC